MTTDRMPCATLRYTSSGLRIECETHILAPREVVWDLIQEPSPRVEWDARVTGVTLLTSRAIGWAHSQTSQPESLAGGARAQRLIAARHDVGHD